MSRIALLHPQCVRLGGAIQMALQTAHALQKQGHEVALYTFEQSPECFPDLQSGMNIEVWHKKTGGKLINMITLAWHLRQVDMIIANNPPMQIVAALAKVFSGKKVRTLWWHHHTPWYLLPKTKIKSFIERHMIIPHIDEMIATSHFVAEKIQEYCGRESVVVHPVIQMNNSPAHRHTREDGYPGLDSRLSGSDETLGERNQITLFTHGRLEAGKGIDMVTRVYDGLKKEGKNIHLIIFGTGSLEGELREQGIDVRPFEGNKTFQALSSGQFGHVVGVYCSSIDAFGMASLESQIAGFSTIIMDSGGAREAILSDDHDEPVGYLVQSEEELLGTISRYVQEKTFPKPLSNVNFSHKRDYFSTERLSSDLLSIITKTSE